MSQVMPSDSIKAQCESDQEQSRGDCPRMRTSAWELSKAVDAFLHPSL